MILCLAEPRIISCLPTHVINLVINDNSLEILYIYIYLLFYFFPQSTPPPPACHPDIAAQFAAQVAATLVPGSAQSSSSQSSSSQRQDYSQAESAGPQEAAPEQQVHEKAQQVHDKAQQVHEKAPPPQSDTEVVAQPERVDSSNGVAKTAPVLHSVSASNTEPNLSAGKTQHIEAAAAVEVTLKDVNIESKSDHNVVQVEQDAASNVVESRPPAVTNETVIHNLPSSTERKVDVVSETVPDDQVKTEPAAVEQPSSPVEEANTSQPAKPNDEQVVVSEPEMDAPSDLVPKENLDTTEEALALVVESKAEVTVSTVEVESPDAASEPVDEEVVSSVPTDAPEKPIDVDTGKLLENVAFLMWRLIPLFE